MKNIGFCVFQSSERAVSVPASPLLIHGQVPVITESDDRENCPPPVHKSISEASRKSANSDEKPKTTSVIPELLTSEGHVVEQTETPSPVIALASAPQLPPPSLNHLFQQSVGSRFQT